MIHEKKSKIQNNVHQLFPIQSENYIFVYTPPKVGSTTLVSSLRVSLGNTFNVIHIHDDIMLSVLTGINDTTVNEIIQYLVEEGKNVYVIDVYRTPIERKMSEYFEKLSPYHFNNTEENINNYSIRRIGDRFNKLFPHLAKGEHYFDKYGIEESIIMPFDFKKKYTLQVINNIKYIKLRLCDSSIWSNILCQVLGCEILIINDYQTYDKGIGELYKRFKSEYKLPSNFIELINNCKFFNFYYNEKERNDYLNIWKSKLCEEVISYTESEYKFYVNLYLENQYINDIQVEHYIDNGCFCELCSKKRKMIYTKAKNGEKITVKIIHSKLINEELQNRNKLLVERYNLVKNTSSNKFKPNQFSINII